MIGVVPLISRILHLAGTVEGPNLLAGRSAIGKIVLTTGKSAT